MKRPQPDIGDILRDQFIGDLKTIRGLKRLWGTEIVDGIEVFTPRQYYHKVSDRSPNFEKLYKFLGAYKDVTEGEYKGVRSAWLYFNKNKGTDLAIDYDDFVSSNLNKMWWDPADGAMPEGLTLTTSVVIEGYNFNAVKNIRVQELLNTSMSESAAIASIEANYEELWDLCNITQEGVGIINKGSIVDTVNNITVPDEDDLTPDDPWLNTIARYALKSQGIPCTIKKVSIGTIQRRTGPYSQDFYTTYVLDIEIPYTNFSATDPIVRSITAALAANGVVNGNPNSYITNQIVRGMDSSDIEDDAELVSRNYDLWEDQATTGSSLTDTLWIKSGKNWYLKAEPFNDPRAYGLKYRQLNNYILSLIDSGYKKKKVPWYKKALAIVLVVVAFIIAIYSGGTATEFSAQLLAVAKAILVASLVLTLAILAFALTGSAEWAAAFMEVSKWIEPLVLIATIVLIVTGISGAIEATKEAAVAGAKMTTAEAIVEVIQSAVQDFVDDLVKGAADVFSGKLLTELALGFTIKLFKILNFGMNMKLESLQDRNKDLKAEYEKLTEEMSKESDALQGFAQIYGKPATADWSMYASLFDLPYERGGGFLSLGNVQRTTKQALRKANYDDPMFAGILII